MDSKQENKDSTFTTSLAFAVILHIVLLIIFHITYFESHKEGDDTTIYLEFDEVEKKLIKETKSSQSAKHADTRKDKFQKIELPKETTAILEKNIIPYDSLVKVDEFDSTVLVENYSDSLAIVDSFLVRNPSIAALKTVIAQRIRDSEYNETDSARVVRTFRENLLAYYKYQYPTPLSKFQEANKGPGMINIPIDDIVNLFK